ncbi:hypothetical protein [Sphingomonas sp. TZW2008]|uniref:hypothetical protein n=1 Tax=Sphingomonas sp. TZW2008 TaxID=1917973 RepID=UPI0011817FA3|nr:hypothetical protein [Sphingomonas sp. TZW2008]
MTAVLGYVGTSHSMAFVTQKTRPALAHRQAPGNGMITAELVEKRYIDDQAKAAQPAIARLARQALQQDPTTVKAVAALGFQAQERGNVPGARRLFAYADRLSRRHILTRLWAIEDAVARNDVPSVLRQYDVALRTSKKTPDILFPPLANAISDATVRDGAVATLARKPIWAPAFVAYVAASGNDPKAVADLLRRINHLGVTVTPEATAVVINRLIGSGSIAAAWQYYAAMRPNADRGRSRDPQFTANLDHPSLFDWVTANESGMSTSIQRGTKGGVFDFAVSSGNGGMLLQQLQLLLPGTYRLTGHSSGIEQPDSALPYWVLSCPGRRELGRVIIPSSRRNNGTFTGQFVVPAGCSPQTLALVARPSYQISGVSGQINQVQLVPLQ